MRKKKIKQPPQGPPQLELDVNTCTATVTCGFLYTGDNFKKFRNEKSIQQSKLLLDFNPPSEIEVVTEKYLPIYPYSDKIKSEFDWEKYQSQLSTKALGQIVIYAKGFYQV